MTIEPPAVWPARRDGFTLIEATMAMVLLGIAATGVLLPFSKGAAVQAEGLRVTLAAKLADNLMERIIATAPSQVVSTWDGYDEPEGQVKDAGGNVFTDPRYARFSRHVDCGQGWASQQTESGPPRPPSLVLVSVQVRCQGREMATLRRLISR